MSYSDNIKVVSMRGGLSQELGWIDIKCDRSSILGNPFTFDDGEYRSPCIAVFRKWLWECIRQAKEFETADRVIVPNFFLVPGVFVSSAWKKPTNTEVVQELKRLTLYLKDNDACGGSQSDHRIRLVCWCGEGNCHADVIKSCLLWMLQAH